MNKHSHFLVVRSLVISFMCISVFSNVFASTRKDQFHSLVINNLQKKLKTDLANENMSVKLENIEEYRISKNQIGLKGNGFCVITSENNEMPMTFNVKVNSGNMSVAEIQYDFAELTDASDYAPVTSEEHLMKELINKISNDYKTKDVVIAIDGVENVSNVTNRNEFTGIGEVRIGTLVWSKIKFDVVFDESQSAATKVIYKVEN